MPVQIEPLNGGVVQNRHASLLRPGELQAADDCILRPGDPSIHRAPGRVAYGTVASSSISTTTDGTTLLISTNGFGADTANVTTTDKSPFISHGSGFGGSPVAGQTIVGTNIPAGTFIRRVVTGLKLELTNAATGASGAAIVTIANIHPGTFISGTDIVAGTIISSITDASNLVMSVAATGSSGPSSRTFSENIDGLRYLPFEGGLTDILLAKGADRLYNSAFTAITGTFAQLYNGLNHDDDATLDAIQAKNRHIILTGFDEPRVIYYGDDDAGAQEVKTRALGMQPVRGFGGAAILEGESWSALETMKEGWYYFLVTEVIKIGPDEEVESTYVGELKAAQITDHTAQGIRVTFSKTASLPVNDGLYGRNLATHWRIYMARNGPNNKLPVPPLSSFKKVVDDVSITDISVDLIEDAVFQEGFAAAVAANASDDSLFPDGTTGVLSQTPAQSVPTVNVTQNAVAITNAGFGTVEVGMVVTSPSNNFPPGTVVVDTTVTNVIIVSNPAVATVIETLYFGNSDTFIDGVTSQVPINVAVTPRGGLFSNFGIQNQGALVTATITGVEVEIHGWVDDFVIGGIEVADPGFRINLRDTSSVFGVEQQGTFSPLGPRTLPGGNVVTEGIIRLGGPGQKWGINWSPADFINGTNFAVRVRQNAGVVGHHIDGIKITIYSGVGNLNLQGDTFHTVVINAQIGTAFASPAKGPPPVASTGDLYEGMLILNDKANGTSIVASLPDQEDSFPDIYRLPFESREKDKVTVIRRLQNTLVVGCENSVKRVNYFPREFDAEFNTGRAWENIATDHGMVGPQAAKLIDIPGKGTLLAYLAHNGLHWTDGVTTRFLNEDLDWTSLVEPSLVHRSTLEVYPHLSLLALYYVPFGGTEKTAIMYFSYHPVHLKEGLQLPATGPVDLVSGSAARAFLAGRTYLLTGHGRDGVVYVEDQGTSDAAGNDIDPVIRTRRIFPAGIGNQTRVQRILLLTDADGTATTGGFTAIMRRQNQGEAVATDSTVVDLDTSIGGIIDIHGLDAQVESFDVQIAKAEASTETSDLRLHYWAYEIESYGTDTDN